MKATTQNILNVLSAFVKQNEGQVVEFEQIKQAVNTSDLKVTNWMAVRNVMQYLCNNGQMTRVDNIFVEQYSCNLVK